MSAAAIFVLGATHHQAPIEVREKLALDSEDISVLHRQLAALPGLREFAVLSTCNRTEFYGVAADSATVAGVQAAFCARRRFNPADFEKIRLELRGHEALQHLFEVAVGLDSQMIGETEIFGQVKEAYAGAQSRRSTGPVLNRVFQKAFQAAKQARSATAITVGQVSVASVAVELALSIFGSLDTARILLLGAGEIGEKTARRFSEPRGRQPDRRQPAAGAGDGPSDPFGRQRPPLRPAGVPSGGVRYCGLRHSSDRTGGDSRQCRRRDEKKARPPALPDRFVAPAQCRSRRRRIAKRLSLQSGRSLQDCGRKPRRPRGRGHPLPSPPIRAFRPALAADRAASRRPRPRPRPDGGGRRPPFGVGIVPAKLASSGS